MIQYDKTRPIFVTGIDTGVGKTVCSAVLTTALDADYWKPVQAGDLHQTDTHFIQSHASLKQGKIHPELFALKEPMAPHGAAELENIHMRLTDFSLPQTNNTLVIEGAGGCMVPINNTHTLCDLMQSLKAQVVVVVKNYLGSINHTLLTINHLQSLSVDVLGLIISGDRNACSEDAYVAHGMVPIVGHVEQAKALTKEFIREQADVLAKNLQPLQEKI